MLLSSSKYSLVKKKRKKKRISELTEEFQSEKAILYEDQNPHGQAVSSYFSTLMFTQGHTR